MKRGSPSNNRDEVALDDVWRRGPLGYLPRPRYTRRIVSAIYENVEILDVTGPISAFAIVNEFIEKHYRGLPIAYKCELIGKRSGPVRTSAGIALVADRSFAAESEPIDTLIIPGGPATRTAAADSEAVKHVRRLAKNSRRVSSVCSGARILAEAGLLDGRTVVTHWASCDALAADYPSLSVAADRLFIRDGNIYTSGGITAGIDLALAMIEEDLGRGWALFVAREMVVYLQRPGGQSQFSVPLRAQFSDTAELKNIPNWIIENLTDDLSISALAHRAAMSERTFARRFKEVMGVTPAKFVETARLEVARRRLEESELPLTLVAAEVGFGSGERLRRAFNRQYGVSPNYYKDRFGYRGSPSKASEIGQWMSPSGH